MLKGPCYHCYYSQKRKSLYFQNLFLIPADQDDNSPAEPFDVDAEEEAVKGHPAVDEEVDPEPPSPLAVVQENGAGEIPTSVTNGSSPKRKFSTENR